MSRTCIRTQCTGTRTYRSCVCIQVLDVNEFAYEQADAAQMCAFAQSWRKLKKENCQRFNNFKRSARMCPVVRGGAMLGAARVCTELGTFFFWPAVTCRKIFLLRVFYFFWRQLSVTCRTLSHDFRLGVYSVYMYAVGRTLEQQVYQPCQRHSKPSLTEKCDHKS